MVDHSSFLGPSARTDCAVATITEHDSFAGTGSFLSSLLRVLSFELGFNSFVLLSSQLYFEKREQRLRGAARLSKSVPLWRAC